MQRLSPAQLDVLIAAKHFCLVIFFHLLMLIENGQAWSGGSVTGKAGRARGIRPDSAGGEVPMWFICTVRNITAWSVYLGAK